MRHIVRYGIIAVFLVAGVLLIVGCGGDDDKGTGPSSLSTQEQLNDLNEFVNLEPDSTGQYFEIENLILLQPMAQFWDGIDSSDFDDFTDIFSGGGLAASAPTDADTSITISYDPVGGWWYVDVLLIEAYPQYGFYTSIALKDSVRFETSEGTVPPVLDETTIDRVLQHASLTIGISFGTSGNMIQFDLQAGSDLDASGLTTSTVGITGNGSYAFSISAENDQGSVDMTVSMESIWNDVSISDATGDNPCPTSGSVTGNFTLDIDAQDNTGHYAANGDWDLGVDFIGGGNTIVSVQSGNFQKSYTGNICSK